MKSLRFFTLGAAALCMAVSTLAFSSLAQAADFSSHKVAVVYFSLLHNRVHGNPDAQEGKSVGNTETIARLIAENTGGELFALEVVNPYPEDYDATVDMARDEQNAKARPALKSLPDVSDCDVVFLGYPNWWGTYPMAVATYLDSGALKGKTVIPFCTHEGSRLGRSQGDVEAALPDSTVLDGYECRGRNVTDEGTPAEVKEFLNGLSLKALRSVHKRIARVGAPYPLLA
ncbi:MAG TPA: flavodoxin [Candidatus Avisuccinivibrio pullicola]|nr:flavodoxin [Candidatus Avisuccinivibrio pullicola]